jgi:hypothetical protein
MTTTTPVAQAGLGLAPSPVEPTEVEKKVPFGDAPDLGLLVAKDTVPISQFGAATPARCRFEPISIGRCA